MRRLGAIGLGLLWCGLAGAASREEYDHLLTADVKVPTRDGVLLATDVYLPARDGKPAPGRFPVILYRTPYNKIGLKTDGAYFARRGYVAVAQDCRGRFGSEGDFYPFVNEGQDGYDTIEWVAGQPWSNGKVGTAGGSYLAWDQYHAAMYRPPHLVAMFALVGGANFIAEFGHPGGTPNLGWPIWILNSAASSPAAARDPEARAALGAILKQPGDWLALHPRERAKTLAAFPAHRKVYEDLYAHPLFDSYWRQRGFYIPGYHSEMKDVPTLFVSGWYDYFGEGVLENFRLLSRRQKAMQRLVMGPWSHGVGPATCGNADFGPQAGMDLRALALDWFDRWMKNDPFEIAGDTPVRIFRMGGGDGSRDEKGRLRHGGEWKTASQWPPPARLVKYFLHESRELAARKPGAGKPATIDFDPDNPVPTIGGRYGGGRTPSCLQDQVCSPQIMGCKDSRPLAQRPDVVSFASEPLAEAVEVTGPVRARLWVSSDAPDTDFTAKLVDVYQDGYAAIIADGQIRARYRRGQEREVPLDASKVFDVTIELGSTSNLFARGHRIRLDVTSSNYPKFESNPNTGEPAWSWTRKRKARNTVYLDARHPSHVELPVRLGRDLTSP